MLDYREPTGFYLKSIFNSLSAKTICLYLRSGGDINGSYPSGNNTQIDDQSVNRNPCLATNGYLRRSEKLLIPAPKPKMERTEQFAKLGKRYHKPEASGLNKILLEFSRAR